MSSGDIALMAHLMRRAGFGADYGELEARAAKGYEATVEELLDPESPVGVQDDILRRYHPDHAGMIGMAGPAAYWLTRMISSKAPLQEKMALFWHSVFATGYAKLAQGKVLMDQIRMFRNRGMGSLQTLLVELSRDPSMIMWLDNYDNHKGAINENYGRELLELFSMGVGNYSEQDIQECARAFTGWTVANTEYMEMRVRNDSLWPFGRLNLHFEYRSDDHDDGEVSFLGETGRLSGEQVVEIICQQPATARFISRHLYNFFVADEPPVPQWPFTPPRDPAAIDALSEAYFTSGYDLRSMLRVLFTSDFFRSEDCRFAKVKSPAEVVVGVLRLTGEFTEPHPQVQAMAGEMSVMGQTLVNPPSVEGWHAGTEWIDTGTLVERVNFAAERLGDLSKPGVQAMIGRLMADSGGVVSPERLVQDCLELMGAIRVSDDTRSALLGFASKGGDLEGNASEPNTQRRVADMLQLVASTPEFQRG